MRRDYQGEIMMEVFYRLAFAARLLFIALLGFVILSACGRLPETSFEHTVPGGDPDRGRLLFTEYGCGSCHTIPGVPRANAVVAPPLTDWAERRYIAGRLPNNPDNLIEWIMSPQAVDPGNAMPDMGVNATDARDMSAYLYTLQRGR